MFDKDLEIIVLIVFLVGLIGFSDAIMNKFKLWRKLEIYSTTAMNKFVYRLLNCRFCMKFHLSWVYLLILLFVNIPKIFYVPFVVSGLIYLIKNKL